MYVKSSKFHACYCIILTAIMCRLDLNTYQFNSVEVSINICNFCNRNRKTSVKPILLSKLQTHVNHQLMKIKIDIKTFSGQ